MAFDAGSAVVKLEGLFESRGFDKYERAVRKARSEKDIVTHARVDADTRGVDKYNRAIKGTAAEHDNLTRSAHGTSGALGTIGKSAAYAAGPFALYGLFKVTQNAFGAFKESQRVGRQTNAVLESTGKVANVTAKEVGDLATQISKKTGIDDEAIQSGENLLLTFTNIRNEAGKGNDIFTQTTHIMTDMSAALGQDTKSSAIQLGKALNDPIKGVTALQRVGVSFTAKQKEQIKTLEESGHHLDAQKLILRELNKEFGGSAEKTATSSAKLKVQLGNLAEGAGRILSPLLEKAAGSLNKFVTGMVEGKGAGGDFLDVVKDVGSVVGEVIGTVIDAGKGVAQFFEDTYERNKKTLEGVKDSFNSLVQPVEKTLNNIAAAFKRTFGGDSGASKDLRQIIDAVIKVWAAFEKYLLVPLVKRLLPAVEEVFGGMMKIVKGALDIISGILTGDFGKAWEGVKKIFSGALLAVRGILRGATAPIRQLATLMWKGISAGARAAWDAAMSVARGGLDFVLGGISSLLDTVGKIVDAASHLPFVGGKFKGLAKDINGARDSIDKYRESLRKTDKEHDKIPGATRKGARGIGNLADAARDAAKATNAAGQTIKDSYNVLADQFGAKKITYDVSKLPVLTKQNPIFKARGGFLPGTGLQDSVPVLAAPDEAFVTRHQQGPIESALAFAKAMGVSAYGSLGELFGSVTTPHYMARGGYPGVSGDTDFVPALGRALSALARAAHTNIFVQSGRRTMAEQQAQVAAKGIWSPSNPHGAAPASPNAPHVRGIAGDITPGREVLGALAARFGLGFTVPGEPWHIQLLNAAAGSAAGAFGGTVRGARITGPGPMGDLLRKVAGRERGMAQKFLDGQAGAAQGGSAPTAAGRYGFDALRRLWVRAGGPASVSSLMAHIALAESGGDPNAYNPSGATGLWQILGAVLPGNLRNALVNARNAVAKWRAGGTAPWNASKAVWGRFASRGGWVRRAGGGFASPRATTAAKKTTSKSQHGKGKGQLLRTPETDTWNIPSSAGLQTFTDASGTYNTVLTRIDDLGTKYGVWDRQFNLTDEEFVNDDGTLNTDAINHRANELSRLISIRKVVVQQLKLARAAARQMKKGYDNAIKRLRRILKTASGSRRKSVKAMLKAYGERRAEWAGKIKEITNDKLPNAKIDVQELVNERAGVLDTQPTTDDSGKDDGSGDTPIDDGTPPDAAPAAPTAEDIARAAAEQLSAFNENRQQLFSQFGSNFVTAGARAVSGDANIAAAGARNFGAYTSGDQGAGAGGSKVVNIVNNYEQPPPDPHTWSAGVEHELTATG